MQIDSILNLSGQGIKDIINNSSNKKELLRNPKIREKIFENKNHYTFLWILQNLKNEEILYLCDKDLLPYLEKDTRRDEKIHILVSLKNKYLTSFLMQPTVLNYLFETFNNINYYLEYYDYSFSLVFMKYLIKHHPDKPYYMSYLNPIYFDKILNDNEVKSFFETSVNLSEFLYLGSIKTLNALMAYPKFKNVFLNSSLDIIHNKIENGFILPIDLLNNENFIMRFVQLDDVTLYRSYIETLKINNIQFAEKIEEKRKKYYQNIMKTIDKNTGIFPHYLQSYLDLKNRKEFEGENYNIYYSLMNIMQYDEKDTLYYLQMFSEKQMFEIIVDCAFEDIPYNFYQNLKLLLDYYDKIEEKFIPDKRLQIYKKIYQFDTLSINSKLDFFKEILQEKQLVELFYDDFSNAKKNCYESLKNSVISKEMLEGIKSKKLSEEYKIPIYELKGEPFKLLITSTKILRDYPYGDDAFYGRTSSISFISDENVKTFGNPYENIVLGFTNFDPKRIMHLYPEDSYSAYEQGSTRISKLYTPDEFVRNTMGYNEILYSNISFEEECTIPLKADYIVCFDTIEKGDIYYSKANGNIPIILLHSSYYRKDNRFNIDSNADAYFPDVIHVEDDYYKKKS